MLFILFDMGLAGCAIIYATMYWGDPAVQFYVGANTSLAVWCICDVIKGIARR